MDAPCPPPLFFIYDKARKRPFKFSSLPHNYLDPLYPFINLNKMLLDKNLVVFLHSPGS